jgi:hypothetical protein
MRLITAGGVAELVLAYLRPADVVDLPPNSGGTPPSTGPAQKTPALDFDAFYDLLQVQPATPDTDPNRPLPHFNSVKKHPGCGVNITRFPIAQADTVGFQGGVKTFMCIPASAELGP